MAQPRRSRRRPGPARGDKDVRAALLEAAERLLAERSLADLAVEDVLREAGVSRASFYFYFESKHAIVAALLERIIDEVHAAALPWFERDETPPGEALRAAISGSLELWRRHRPVMTASVEHWQSVPELREVWGGVIARFIEASRARIDRDREQGAAPPGADANRLAAALVLMNERCFYYAVAAGDPSEDAALVDTLTGVWMASVYGTA
jgi:TetR/AcrR family transcriptional regulator, ethionamide resistance regulator